MTSSVLLAGLDYIPAAPKTTFPATRRSSWGGKMSALAVVETPSGKDAIAEGLLDLLKPAVQQLDLHVHAVR